MNRLFVLLGLAGASGLASTTIAAEAKDNWDQYCVKCHAADGTGKTKMGQKLKVKDYSDPAVQAEFTDEQLAKITREGSVKDGKELMKGFKDDLSDSEINALVVHVRSLKK